MEKCIHCGTDCGKDPIRWNDKPFCCMGCSQVYQILHTNKLQQYYHFAELPGIKVEAPAHSGKYAFLDRTDIQHKMYEYFENGVARITLYIPAIHCVSCIWLLENLHKLHSGIIQSSVNFAKKNVQSLLLPRQLRYNRWSNSLFRYIIFLKFHCKPLIQKRILKLQKPYNIKLALPALLLVM